VVIYNGFLNSTGRQVLWIDGNSQTLTTLQFWINPLSGPKIAKRLGYVQAAVEVPSLGITLELKGTSVWYSGVQLAFPPQAISVDVQFAVVFWSRVTEGDWFIQYF
jgi:hypothetical protein